MLVIYDATLGLARCLNILVFFLIDLKNCKSLKHIRQLHAVAIKTEQIDDPLIAAEIVRFLALSSSRDLTYALQVFDKIPEPNSFSWNTIIRAFAESDEPHLQPFLLFLQLLHNASPEPNRFTYPSLLKACARISAIEEGKQIHCHTVKPGYCGDEFVITNLTRIYALYGNIEDARRLVANSSLPPCSEAYAVLHNIMIDGYCRAGMLSYATLVFEELRFRSVTSWNGMISRYIEVGRFQEAVDLFFAMQMDDVLPYYVTLVSILPAISRLGVLGIGKWVHVYAAKNDIDFNELLSVC